MDTWDYTRLAEEADRKAARADDAGLAEAWSKLAATYRDLARLLRQDATQRSKARRGFVSGPGEAVTGPNPAEE